MNRLLLSLIAATIVMAAAPPTSKTDEIETRPQVDTTPPAGMQFEKGDVLYFSSHMTRTMSDHDLARLSEAHVPVPYDRLDKKNIAHWEYKLRACKPTVVHKAHEDGSVSVDDEFVRFRVSGQWKDYAYRDEKQCMLAAIVLVRAVLKKEHATPVFSFGGEQVVFH